MLNEAVLGYSLVSQQIREEIVAGNIIVPEGNIGVRTDGKFEDQGLESRVQPSSFEPTLGSTAFILDDERHSAFRPRKSNTVLNELMRLPRSQRNEVDISRGFELKKGFTYLIPLRESISLGDAKTLHCSPKSSTGRVFSRTRVLMDYNPRFDRIDELGDSRQRRLWMMVQPGPFNMIVHPGLTLVQIRPFNGVNVSLSQRELMDAYKKDPMLWERNGENHVPLLGETISDNGLELNLDLSGSMTHGVVGLRARRTPEPIDLSKKEAYDPENFFEPVIPKEGRVSLVPGEHYLLVSSGELRIPPGFSCELRRHSENGVRGSWDEAGFVDPGFRGDLVSEAVINERGSVEIPADERFPVSALEFFRNSVSPDKIYGAGIGSNYQGQRGIKVSKHFRPFDFARAAKEYEKLNREVLVCDPRTLMQFRTTVEGFEPISPKNADELVKFIEREGFFQSRYECETDTMVLQPIPYGVLFGKDSVFSYVRAKEIKDYGDRRLFGKLSIGVGGHIGRNDSPNKVRRCIERELAEEVEVQGTLSEPRIIGMLFARDEPVDRFHFGLVYTCKTDGLVKLKEKSGSLDRMMPLEEAPHYGARYETWSRILVPHLETIYKFSK